MSQTLDVLSEAAQVWAAQNGLLMGAPNAPACHLVHAPITLLPSPIPRKAYEQVGPSYCS